MALYKTGTEIEITHYVADVWEIKKIGRGNWYIEGILPS